MKKKTDFDHFFQIQIMKVQLNEKDNIKDLLFVFKKNESRMSYLIFF